MRICKAGVHDPGGRCRFWAWPTPRGLREGWIFMRLVGHMREGRLSARLRVATTHSINSIFYKYNLRSNKQHTYALNPACETIMNDSPPLSLISTWTPVLADAARGVIGGVVGPFSSLIKLPGHQEYGLVLTGWSFSGFDTPNPAPEPVRVQLLAPDSTGLYDATAGYLKDPTTNGAGSVIVADFNNDRISDIFLAAHNESPFLPLPSTVYMSTPNGQYTKVVLSDSVTAHDATLIQINGKPAVLASTYVGMDSPLYQYENGNFVVTPFSPGRYSTIPEKNAVIAGATSVVNSFDGSGELQVVRGDVGHYNEDWSALTDSTIEVYAYNKNNTVSEPPLQVITPYLSTLPQYANIVSMHGRGLTHTYALHTDDLNHDGFTDILASQSMWSDGTDNWPSALQILLNDRTGHFTDKTSTLNPSIPLNIAQLDFAPTFIDIDGSGIDTYLFAGSNTFSPERQSNFVMLNDGTGRLHIGMHDEFRELGRKVIDFVSAQFIGNPHVQLFGYSNHNNATLKFTGIPQADGSIDFMAQTELVNFQDPANPQAFFAQTYVETGYNPATDFTQDIVIADRNDSKLIRTWAGNDTIYDTNSAVSASIKGGLGFDTVVYSASSAHAVVSRTDAGFTVQRDNGITDSLQGVEKLQFSDSTIELPSIIDGFNPAAIYRFYNDKTGAHFYTASVHEAENVLQGMPSFTFEGVAFNRDIGNADTIDIFRFYNTSTNTHFYTASAEEAESVRNTLPQYRFEGVAYEAHGEQQAGTTALYRFFNTETGTHFYTANQGEMENVRVELAGTMTYEGVAYYVVGA